MLNDSLHKENILQILNSHKQELLNYGVKEIGLFGSYVRNEATKESDIDLLVDIVKEKKTFRNFMALSYYLEELFGKKVELVTKQSLSPYIGPHILKTVEYVSLAS
jgi:predicted nucleotidyltransferase